MNRTKLGLDIGTNSIGWTVLEKEDKKYRFFYKEDQDGNLIPTKGSYIFPKGTEANEKSKAATRRGFRSSRRRIDRIRRRKVATLNVLSSEKLCPSISTEELNNWRYNKKYPCENVEFIEWQKTGTKGGSVISEKNKQPYYLRYLAASQEGLMNSKHGRYQLGRVFYHLSQRRGYKSIEEDEQTDDKIEQFKGSVMKLIEENSSCASFYEPFLVVLDTYKSDKKVEQLGKKILQKLKKEISYEVVSNFILDEFVKKENLGKVESGIQDLSQRIENSGQPTLGCYFYSIYAQKNEDGSFERIRGRYIDREKHYLHEFNFICEKQNLSDELKKKLHSAIFYQRPLKSQKGLVAKCPLEPKRKRIAVSHPLFEEFRMWESINRIKIKTEVDSRLRPLVKYEKELIIKDFQQKTDFEFEKLAKKLSKGKDFRYIRDKNKLSAEIEFNFPMDKTFSACPTSSQLKRILKEKYESIPSLNSGYKNEKGKRQVSVEDIWHCLFADSFGKKDKKEARKDFALKHLNLTLEEAEVFSKIKLKKGYGSLSKSAIKKILPFLKEGQLYSHAVFLANITSVLGRQPSEKEKGKILNGVKKALEKHEFEKAINAIANNYIEKFKNENNGLGSDSNSIWVHQNGIQKEIYNWFSESELSEMGENEILRLEKECWVRFSNTANEKRPKDIEFLKSKTIPDFIGEMLKESFPDDEIKIEKLYHPSAMETYPRVENKLGNPEVSSIKNPVFNRAMHQIKHLVNKLIEVGLVNKDTEVNIEMAREINSASYRRAISLYQKDQEFIRKWAREKIIECYEENERENIIPTDDQIIKYILYAEQNGRCLYTNEMITPRKFFSEQKFDIEHTIPRSKNNDNSLKNKTLANADFNRNYKKDELPANIDLTFNGEKIDGEIILQNRDNYLHSYTISNGEVQFNVELDTLKNDFRKFRKAATAASGDPVAHDVLMEKAYLARLKLDYLAEKYKMFEIDEVTTKFTNANLVDTRIIAKYARAYLKSYFKNVNVVNGQITDTLRKLWGLQGEYEEKDRSNHIHHCIDAITVACVEKGTVNRMSESFHKFERDYFMGNIGARALLPEPIDNFVATIKSLKNEVFVFHKQIDRIRPLIDEFKKEKPKLSNLRGALNNQKPYGIRKRKNGEYFFVQRKDVTTIKEKDIANISDERIQERIQNLSNTTGKKIEKLVSENGGLLILPEYEALDKKGKLVKSGTMVIKKIRLISSKTKLSPYKKIRKIDLTDKPGQEYKHDYYFDKEAGSNYEAILYGELIPDESGKMKRDYRLINHYNIVKNIFGKEPSLPVLFKIHTDDMFLIFNKHFDEITWEDNKELQSRLFKNVKFDENGILVFERHNYADGDVDHARPVKEDNLNNLMGKVLRRSPTTFRAVPTRVDELGRIDIEYSKAFIQKHT
nr:CRISPR-associated protein Cas9 [uncultured bacterium]